MAPTEFTERAVICLSVKNIKVLEDFETPGQKSHQTLRIVKRSHEN